MRSHFQLPPSICYLNAASETPRPIAAAEAGHQAIGRSEQPWSSGHRDPHQQARRVRTLAGAAIGAESVDIALVPSVSYGMAVAAANLQVRRGGRIILIEDDHLSTTLMWQRVAATRDAEYDVVRRPVDADWTSAILRRVENVDEVSVAVLSPVHWADGTLIDLDRLVPSLRARGAAIVIDATQAAGVLDFRVDSLDVDFVAFPAYKWLLGPYGMAFLYVSPRFQNGRPLEEHMGGRKAPALEQASGLGDLSYGEGARRFDRGERDESVSLSVAASALGLAQSISFRPRLDALCGLRDCLIDELAFLPVDFAPPEFRSPHIIGIGLRGRDPARVAELLARESVFVSARRGFLRVSPYMYNNTSDIRQFCNTFRRTLTNSS